MPNVPSKQPTVLAIDLGAKMGWAAVVDGHVESGAVKHNGKVTERLGRFFDWVTRYCPSEHLVFEHPYRLRSHAATSLLGMAGVIRAVGWVQGIEVSQVTPSEAKRVTGSGKATKGDVIAWAREKYGVRKLTPDQADALAVLEVHLRRHA